MPTMRRLQVDSELESPVHHGRLVEIGGQDDARRSVPVRFHLGTNGSFGNFSPENQTGLGGLRLNSTVLLDAGTSVGRALVRIGERDLVGPHFPFTILEVLGGSPS